MSERIPEPVKATGDIGRRMALRREELGLSPEEVAERAGTAPGYLRYVEEQPTADPGPGFLRQIAEVLETTVSQLRGGDADLPPGTGRAAGHPDLTELDPGECRALIGTHGVGRVAVTTGEGPAIIPVNYTVADGTIAFRTAPEAAPALAAGTDTAFEIDHIDEALSQGWSVLAVGPATYVTDAAAVRRLTDRAPTGPWAGGDRELWVRIDPVRISGRRIRAR